MKKYIIAVIRAIIFFVFIIIYQIKFLLFVSFCPLFCCVIMLVRVKEILNYTRFVKIKFKEDGTV